MARHDGSDTKEDVIQESVDAHRNDKRDCQIIYHACQSFVSKEESQDTRRSVGVYTVDHAGDSGRSTWQAERVARSAKQAEDVTESIDLPVREVAPQVKFSQEDSHELIVPPVGDVKLRS